MTERLNAYIKSTSLDMDGGKYAVDVYTDDKVAGENVKNEITLVAHI